MLRRFQEWFHRRPAREKVFIVIGWPIIAALPILIVALPPGLADPQAGKREAAAGISAGGTMQGFPSPNTAWPTRVPSPTPQPYRPSKVRPRPVATATATPTPDVALAMVASTEDILPTPTETATVVPTATPMWTPTPDPELPTPTLTATATSTPRAYLVLSDLKLNIDRPAYVPMNGNAQFTIRIQNTSLVDVHAVALRIMPDFYRHFELRGSSPKASRTIDLFDGSQRLEFDGVPAGKARAFTVALHPLSAGIFSFEVKLYINGSTMASTFMLQSLDVGYPTPSPTPTLAPTPSPSVDLLPLEPGEVPTPTLEPL